MGDSRALRMGPKGPKQRTYTRCPALIPGIPGKPGKVMEFKRGALNPGKVMEFEEKCFDKSTKNHGICQAKDKC